MPPNSRTMLLGRTDGGIIRRMNSASRPTTRDLFSQGSGPGTSLQPGNPPSSQVPNATTATSSPRHILPSDLTNAIRRLEDGDLDRLLSAILAEQRRRGKNIPSSNSPRKRQQVEVPTALTSGKLNAVRAAFKAGITPSRIARQFGISQSDVRKALASDATKPR